VVVVDWANRLKEIESRKNSFVSTEDHQNYWLEFEARTIICDDNDNLDLFANAILRRTANIYKELKYSYFNFMNV